MSIARVQDQFAYTAVTRSIIERLTYPLTNARYDILFGFEHRDMPFMVDYPHRYRLKARCVERDARGGLKWEREHAVDIDVRLKRLIVSSQWLVNELFDAREYLILVVRPPVFPKFRIRTR